MKFVQEALSKPKRGGPPAPFFLYLAHIAPHWPLHAREADIAPHRDRYRRAGWDEWRDRRFVKQREMGLVPPSWRLSPRPGTVPAWQLDDLSDWQAERMAVYAAQVASLDASLGRVMDVVRRAGAIPADDPHIQRGVGWLKTHQRTSGRWFTRSLWKDQKHYLSHDGTAYAILALAECGEIKPDGVGHNP